MEQLRLFIALPFDPGLARKINKQFLGLNLPWTAIKTVLPEQMHVTLRFLGAVPLDKLPELISALEQVKKTSVDGIDLTVEKAVASPERHPEVISLKIAEQESLLILHKNIEDALYQSGLAHRENRQYKPHLTLGRIKQTISPDDLGALKNWLIKEQCTVSNFDLMQSELTPRGPIYTVLQSFDL